MSEVNNRPVLVMESIKRNYHQGEDTIRVLAGASLCIHPGEVVALLGPSGSGKSTLLHAIGLLEHPDSGSIRIAGVETTGLDDDARSALRRDRIGFVYQSHRLLPEFSALENVMLPQMIAGVRRRAAADKARVLLDAVGLGHRLAHRPARLSGGEQQRVAIARALANSPDLLVADEPTGNLDPATAAAIAVLLIEAARRRGAAVLMATHSRALAGAADRAVELRDGVIIAATLGNSKPRTD